MRLLLVALTLCGLAAGQSTARIEGRVVSQSGEPLRKVTVRIQSTTESRGDPPAIYVEISDSAGRFAFGDVSPGHYFLSAQRTGFSMTQTPNDEFTLQARDVRNIEIKLVQLGIISGQVTDQDGDPLFGVLVQAMHFQYSTALRPLVPGGSAMSDDQGNFRILSLEPGRYYAMSDNQRARTNYPEHRGRSAQETDVRTFYPGAPDFNGAAAIDVGIGTEVRGIKIQMIRGRVFTIRGKAVDRRTGAPATAALALTPKSTIHMRGGISTQTTGTFEFQGLTAGTYILQAMPRSAPSTILGNNVPNLAGRVEVNVTDSDVDGLVLAVGPPPEITGTVRAEGGDLQTLLRPLTGFGRIGDGGHPGITLANVEDANTNTPRVQVEADGTFKIQNVAWSRYKVDLRAISEGTYIKSMRFGAQDVIKSPLDVTSGVGGTLEILLSPKAAEVDCTVHGKNAETVAGITVTIWPKTTAPVGPLSGYFRTGQDGSVRLTSIPPGEYYVAAWEDVDPGFTSDPDFLARFTEQAATVKVGESDKASVDLTLISKDKIAAAVAKLP